MTRTNRAIGQTRSTNWNNRNKPNRQTGFDDSRYRNACADRTVFDDKNTVF